MIARPAYSRPENGQPRLTSSAATGFTTSSTIDAVTSAGSHGSGEYAPMPPVLGPGVPVADPLEVLRGKQGDHDVAVDDAEQRYLRPVEERLQQHRMAGVEKAGGVHARGVAVGAHDDALACGQPVVLDHPRRVACGRAEPVERGVEMGGVVDDLTGGGADPRGVHDVLGEGLRPLDAGRVLRRAEARDPRRPHRVGDAEHQRHLGSDHDQVGADPLRQLGRRPHPR